MWRAAAGRLGTVRQALGAQRPPFAPLLEAQAEPAGLSAPLQVRWAKRSKRKKKPKRADRTPERIAASGGAKERIFDNVLEPETPYQMATTVRKHLRDLTTDGRHITRRKKDMTSYTNYRLLRLAGLTHDGPKEEVDRRGFVTPLTEMQDRARLPRSPLHRRFHFPHTLNYKVYWGPPSVQDEPNKAEGSMVGCGVAVRLHDLPLTQRQRERIVDIVGPSRVDEGTDVLALEVDDFPERNHNAALLGDMLEQLLSEATSLEGPPRPARVPAVGGTPEPGEERAGEE